ncbi:MAG: class I SAM-dependent methyltransferase [Vicinamibacterales bacterium]
MPEDTAHTVKNVPMNDRLADLFREFHAQQRLPEYVAVANRLRERLGVLNAVIEIGVAAGGTLALWAELSAPTGVLIAVDVPSGPEPCYSDEGLRRAAAGRPLVLVRGDSRSPGIQETVSRALGPGRYADFLFIDGGHQAAVVHSDLRTYALLVRDGGLVGFHDIVLHPGLRDVRVHELWGELRARFPAHVEEILEAPDQDWAGIGLLTMAPEVRAYLSAPEPVPIFINNFNRLTSTRALASWVAELPGTRVIILDNDSDWPPVLEWYEHCPFEVRKLRANLGNGHHGFAAPWKAPCHRTTS